MAERKNFFRSVFDALVESRSREADRELRRLRGLLGPIDSSEFKD